MKFSKEDHLHWIKCSFWYSYISNYLVHLYIIYKVIHQNQRRDHV